MTLPEVASYLKLAEKTILRMIHRNEIPCAKIGNQWRFSRAMINDWFHSKMQVVPRNDIARLIERGDESVPLSRLVREQRIVFDIQPGAKEDVLTQLIRPLIEEGIIENLEEFLSKLLYRESIISTSVGSGAAIPHIRDSKKNPPGGPYVVLGICPEGTDFDATDGEKTQLFFLVSTDSEVVHLRILSRITQALQTPGLVRRIVAAGTPGEVVRILMEVEK